MASFLYKTKAGTDLKGKPRVFFTCHAEDFDRCFTKITEDILKNQDCAIYYTADMNAPMEEENLATDLGQMSLFVVPVTRSLLTTPNRTMDGDLVFAKAQQIPILPFMMERDLDEIYSQEDKFGQRQYLNPNSTDLTEIRYEDKLKNYLESTLISDELARRIRAAFDAYIFLSYRKKDRRYANELMRLIHKNPECRDVAIWYDEFLTPGESFADSIRKALEDSKLFALLVTPSLLEEYDGKPNFVMATEYPEAQKAGKNILPAEMEPTDHGILAEKFPEIPRCVDPREEAFRDRLVQAIEKVAISANNNDPEHNFLIGLAYLEGIDVEVDRLRGIQQIIAAAEAGLPEAMKRLMELYAQGQYVPQDRDIAIEWAQKLLDHYANTEGEDCPEALLVLEYLGGLHKHEKAIEYYEKAYALNMNKNHKHTQWSEQLLDKLAGRYQFVDKKRAIEAKNKQYLACLELYGHQDTHTILVLDGVAECHYKAEDYDQAAFIYAQVRELERQAGVSEKIMLSTTNNLAAAYIAAGQMALALDLMIEVCEKSEAIYPDDHWTRATHWGNLGYVNEKLGNVEKAIAYCEKSYLILCQSPRKDQQYRFEVKDSRRSLIELYERHQAHAEMEAFLEKECHRLEREDVAVEEMLDALEAIAEAYKQQGNRGKELDTLRKLYATVFELSCKDPNRVRFIDWQLNETLDKMSAACEAMGNNGQADFYREKKEVQAWLKSVDAIKQPFSGTYTALGRFYQKCGDPYRALALAETAYEETVSAKGEVHKESLEALLNLTCGFRKVKDYPQMLKYLTKLLDLQVRYLEDSHPGLIKNRRALATLYRQMNMPQLAEQTEALIARYTSAAESLPDSADELKKLLAVSYFADKEQILNIQEKLYMCICWESGELSFDALEQLTKLAEAYEGCENYQRAVALVKKAHDMATAVLGENYRLSLNFSVKSNLEWLASLYMKSGNIAKWVETAELCYRHVCEQRGEEISEIRGALIGLAHAYKKAGELQKAADLLEHGCDLQVKRDGDSFIGCIDDNKWANDSLLSDLASIYVKLRNYDRAAPLYEKLYAIRQEVYGKEDDKTLNVMAWLAYVYSEAGQIEKALPLQKEVYDLRVKISGEEAKATVTAMVNLGAMYKQAGDDHNAVVYLEQALQYRSKTLGADHPDTENIRQWIAGIQNK